MKEPKDLVDWAEQVARGGQSGRHGVNRSAIRMHVRADGKRQVAPARMNAMRIIREAGIHPACIVRDLQWRGDEEFVVVSISTTQTIELMLKSVDGARSRSAYPSLFEADHPTDKCRFVVIHTPPHGYTHRFCVSLPEEESCQLDSKTRSRRNATLRDYVAQRLTETERIQSLQHGEFWNIAAVERLTAEFVETKAWQRRAARAR